MTKIDYPADGGGPAHPDHIDCRDVDIRDFPGPSLRVYAAIHLGVPDSGILWLNQMIAKKVRRDLAGQMMVHIENQDSAETAAKLALVLADALLAEQEKGGMH